MLARHAYRDAQPLSRLQFLHNRTHLDRFRPRAENKHDLLHLSPACLSPGQLRQLYNMSRKSGPCMQIEPLFCCFSLLLCGYFIILLPVFRNHSGLSDFKVLSFLAISRRSSFSPCALSRFHREEAESINGFRSSFRQAARRQPLFISFLCSLISRRSASRPSRDVLSPPPSVPVPRPSESTS